MEERDPVWSPDGKSIAYFSDASGEYQLEIRGQSGLGEPRRIGLSERVFPRQPRWSPDSKKIAYTDQQLNVCYVDLEKRTPVKIDTDVYAGPSNLNPSWSPDSKWIAYTRKLKSYLQAVFVYSVEQDKTFQVTDGMSDAAHAVFDKGRQISLLHGKHRRGAQPRLARHVEHAAAGDVERLSGGAFQGRTIAAGSGKR